MVFEGDWIIFPLWREQSHCCRMGWLSHAPGSPGRSDSRASCLLFTQQWQVSQSLFLWTGIPAQHEGVKSVMKMVGLSAPAVGEPAVSKLHATAGSCVPPGLWAPEHSWLGEQGALVWYLTWPWSSSQPTDICNPSLSADYAEGREKYPCEPRLESIWWNVTHSAWEQPGWIRRSLSGIIHLTAGGSNSKLHMSFSEWIPSSPNREGWWGLDFFWQQKIWISTTSYSRLAVFEDICADKYCLKHL